MPRDPRQRSDDRWPLGSPGEWLAEGHTTCAVQCTSRKCNRFSVDIRLETLPQDLPWTVLGPRMACRQCGTVKHSAFTIEDEKPVLAASSFFSVKPPKRPGDLFPGVCLNVVPMTESSTTVVFSYASDHSGDVRKYIAPIILAKGDAQKQRLSEMIVYRTENFFITPSKT